MMSPRPLDIRSKPGVTSFNRDTERFAEFIARDAPRSFLDVGTGTGYLAIRLALTGSEVGATDISARAASLAEENARRCGVALSVQVTDLLDGVSGSYDAIAFNPPFSARPDGPAIALAKRLVRRFGPLERTFMRHMPAPVAAFRRDLIARFLERGIRHLEPEGALYLLLYSHEVAQLEPRQAGLTVQPYSPPALQKRNLVFARLTRTGRVSEADGG